MGTGGTTRAWGDCPECDGVGLIAVVTYAPTDHEMLDDPCPTCTAHFKAVDEARAQGAAEATERCAKLAIPIPPADAERHGNCDDDWCEGFRAGRFAYRDAIRAAGDTVKGGTDELAG